MIILFFGEKVIVWSNFNFARYRTSLSKYSFLRSLQIAYYENICQAFITIHFGSSLWRKLLFCNVSYFCISSIAVLVSLYILYQVTYSKWSFYFRVVHYFRIYFNRIIDEYQERKGSLLWYIYCYETPSYKYEVMWAW